MTDSIFSTTMTSQPKYISLLKDKKAVILGGTSGIGFSLASALIEEGAHVVVASSRQERVDDAVKRLTDPKQQFNADQSRVQGKVVNLKGRESEVSRRKDSVLQTRKLTETCCLIPPQRALSSNCSTP